MFLVRIIEPDGFAMFYVLTLYTSNSALIHSPCATGVTNNIAVGGGGGGGGGGGIQNDRLDDRDSA